MEELCKKYRSQLKKAKDVFDILKKQRDEIELQLKTNFTSTTLHKDLRTLNMDIKITSNEIEHLESCIIECDSKYNTFSN
jgi:hypothetical protein